MKHLKLLGKGVAAILGFIVFALAILGLCWATVELILILGHLTWGILIVGIAYGLGCFIQFVQDEQAELRAQEALLDKQIDDVEEKVRGLMDGPRKPL